MAGPARGFVGACECGWRSERTRPPGDYDSAGYQAAEADFETEHLDPLIAAAKQRSWPDWAARTVSRANETANHIATGRLHDARQVLDLLRDDLNRRITIADQLAEERDRRDNDTDRVADVAEAHDPYGRPFATPTDPTHSSAPATPPTPRADPSRRGRGR